MKAQEIKPVSQKLNEMKKWDADEFPVFAVYVWFVLFMYLPLPQ